MAAWFLRLLFVCLCLIASAFSTKLLGVGTQLYSARLLLLPVICLVMALMQLYYGTRFSLYTIAIAIGAEILFMSYGAIISRLPSPAFAVNNVLFDPLLSQPLSWGLNNIGLFSLVALIVLVMTRVAQKFFALKNFTPTKNSLLEKSKYLSFLMIIYGVIILAANWYDPRFIKIFWFEVDSGTLIFPLTNIVLDMITEVYGYKHARLAIWCGFLFNAIILLIGQIVVHWHSVDAKNFEAYQHFLLFDVRIIIASFVSYFVTEGVSAYILAQLKLLLKGRLMALRFMTSTLVGYLLDVIFFCVIAFTGLMSFSSILYLMLTSGLMMAGVEILLLPLSVRLTKKLKQLECLDIYDEGTHFTLLSLEHAYTKTHNKFLPSN
jgi:uncharacterized integral membrane protein (TIGR00697 family)